MQRPFIEGTQRDYRFCHRVFHQCSRHLVMHIAVLVPIHNPSSKTVTPNVRLIVLAERGVMEILRLDWSLPIQSETQYLQLKLGAIAERKQRGNLLLLCFRSVSAFVKKWKQKGDMFPPCFRSCLRFVSASTCH